MRILFLTHYFPPETNAPAVRTFEHCREWAQTGHEVHVITCFPSHPTGILRTGYRRRWYQREIQQGIHVHRVWTHLAANAGVWRRTLCYLSFILPSVWRAIRLERPDVIVATSPQFFCAAAGWLASVVTRRPWVFELRDLWPESIRAVGALRTSFLTKPLEWIARVLYRHSSAVVCLTRPFMDAVEACGVAREKLPYVPNGIDREFWNRYVDRGPWRHRLGVGRNQFMVGYVGTLGMAHALDTVIEAAGRLETHPNRPMFVLAGDGAERRRLERLVQDRSLGNVLFTGQISRNDVRSLVASLDVALVVLRDAPLFQTVLPSKMFEAMAAGRPVVLGVDGEARKILEDSGGGLYCAPEDATALATAVSALASNAGLRRELGERGRAFVHREFDRRTLALSFAEVLDRVVEADRGRLGDRRTNRARVAAQP